MAQKPQMEKFPLIAKIINGGIAGMIGVSCVFPLDLVKTRLQNQQIGPKGELMYKNMFDCFRKTYRAEGLIGMYHGAAVNILLVTPEKGIKLAANDYFRYKLTTPSGLLPIRSQMLAGGLAGALQIIITTPMELLKIQLQDAGRIATPGSIVAKEVKQISALQITMQLLREKGFFGLYRGLMPTAMRDITFSAIFFPLFSTLNDLGPRRNDDTGEAVFWCSFLSGLGSGSFSAFIVTPLDVLKTRLQAIKKAVGEKEFDGVVDCIKKTFRHEGGKAFFKGGLCRVIVISPLFAIAQTVYYLGAGEAVMAVVNG